MSLPSTWQYLTQGQWPEGRFIVQWETDELDQAGFQALKKDNAPPVVSHFSMAAI